MYMTGFGGHFSTEAVAGALPVGRNSPQQVPFGLYAEQFSGTAFTAPRSENRRSWLYRVRPAASHPPFTPLPSAGRLRTAAGPGFTDLMRGAGHGSGGGRRSGARLVKNGSACSMSGGSCTVRLYRLTGMFGA